MIVIIDCGSSKVPLIEEMVDEFMDFKTVSLFDFAIENEKEALGLIINEEQIFIKKKNQKPN